MCKAIDKKLPSEVLTRDLFRSINNAHALLHLQHCATIMFATALRVYDNRSQRM